MKKLYIPIMLLWILFNAGCAYQKLAPKVSTKPQGIAAANNSKISVPQDQNKENPPSGYEDRHPKYLESQREYLYKKLGPKGKEKLELWHTVLDQILFYQSLNGIKETNPEVCFYEMMQAHLTGECRDYFTNFHPPESAQRKEKETTLGQYSGIGVVLIDKNGKVVIEKTIPSTPAAEAFEENKIFNGDIIIAVDGKDVKNKTEAANYIRGETGTKVTLTLTRKDINEPFFVSLVRSDVQMPFASLRIVEEKKAKAVGIIQIDEFWHKTGIKFRNYLYELREKKINLLILDLRDNSGGEVGTTLEMLSFFMKPDDILITVKNPVYTRTCDLNYLKTQKALHRLKNLNLSEVGAFRKMKIVILTNGETVSAAEMFAGTIQDWGYTVIGEKTFGKGVEQAVETLEDGSEFDVVSSEFFVGNSKTRIHQVGVIPNIEIKQPENLPKGQDPQLEKAIEFLRNNP